ncbi:hypothetical protein C5S31_03365 [ANME-1 cluster archaeon GoMg2]|nr:hypothetical protein [ANME-1 cluster archaeon GoMg2]
MKRRFTVSLDWGLCEQIEEQRGDIPRSRFVNRLLLSALECDGDYKKTDEEVGGYA